MFTIRLYYYVKNFLYKTSILTSNHSANYPPPLSRRLGTVTKLFTINPKDRSVNELYGILDPASRDWTDGLLSNIFRDINRPLPANKV